MACVVGKSAALFPVSGQWMGVGDQSGNVFNLHFWDPLDKVWWMQVHIFNWFLVAVDLWYNGSEEWEVLFTEFNEVLLLDKKTYASQKQNKKTYLGLF